MVSEGTDPVLAQGLAALDEPVAILHRTPRALSALLSGLPPRLLHSEEGGGRWSVRDVVGHLILAEKTNWPVRIRHILDGAGTPFAPFVREGPPMRDPASSLPALLAEFDRLRGENLAGLTGLGLGERDLERRGLHPELGEVTLGQLVATWAVHDLTHIRQIVRVLAELQREAVGPWARYLSVLGDREPTAG